MVQHRRADKTARTVNDFQAFVLDRIRTDEVVSAFRIKLILEAVDPSLVICDNVTAELISEWGLCKDYNSKIDSDILTEENSVTSYNSHSHSKSSKYKTAIFNDICNHPVDDVALANIRSNAIDVDPLYVVFTSGSIGTPKGVVATHRGVIDYIEQLSTVLQVNSDTVFGNQSPLYLDACLKEVYTTLKFGSSAYLIPPSLFMFPVKLVEYINENKINTICWVASALSMVAGLGTFKTAVPESLHTIAFGSEVFPVKHYNLWRATLPDARFIHLYGPTEATGMSCFYETKFTFNEDESIPIGHPFPNTEIILIDDSSKIPEDGLPGEICIRGVCLSPGYFGDREKTSNAFVQNPLSVFPDLIYRTGDLGRRGNEGELYYISRRDHQIKHMGYRIELAEIELVANGCEKVGLACAIFDNDNSRIILYFVKSDINEDTVSESVFEPDKATISTVRAYLKANLPRYMLPQSIFQLSELPRTSGGKLDRMRLLERYKADT